MAKAKRRQLVATASEKDSLSDDEDSWVMVKKQRITILVPPSSPLQPPPQTSRMKRMQNKSKKAVKGRYQIKNKRHLKHPHGLLKKSCASKEEIHFIGGISSDINNPVGSQGLPNKQLPKSTFKTASEGSDTYLGTSLPVTSSRRIFRTCRSPETSADAFRPPNQVSKALNRWPSSFAALKQQDLIHINGEKGTCFERSLISCLNVGAVENQKMRASNVEKKLERAGGLSKWLVSQGLGRFIQMFRRESIDEMQLLNLTMEKLKDMGADAVGPRRKLLHAIDCLSKPCYF